MNKLMKKISIILFVLFVIILTHNYVNAANATLNANSKEIELGDTITLNASVTAAQWKLNININGSSIANSKELDNYEKNITKNFSGTYKPTAAGTYTFNLTGDITDVDQTNLPVNKSYTVTVKEKQTQQQQQTQQQTQTQTQTQQTTQQQQTQQQTTQQQQQAQPTEPNFTNTNQTMYTTGNINLRSSWSTSSAAVSVPAGTEVTVTATSTNKVNGYVWYKVSYNGQTKYVASGLLTSTKPEEKKEEEKKEEEKKEEQKEEKSTNKALKTLEVEGYTLDPAFTSETTKYTLKLKDTDTSLKVKAVASDETKAKVNIEGADNLSTGNNIVKITVTAEDGTTRIYTITAMKEGETANADELKLASLKVANGSLDPDFDKDVKTYILGVEDPSKITAESITAVAADENVNITFAVKDQNDDGEKVITILLESKDEKDTRTGVYQINVRKAIITETTIAKGQSDKSLYYIFGAIIGVLIILIIAIIIALKKTSGDDDYDDDYDDEDEYDEADDNYEDDYEDRNSKSPRYDKSLKDAIDEANTIYDYDADDDLSPKSQILSNKLPNRRNKMDETQMFDSDKFNEISQTNAELSKRRGKHF